MEYLGVVCTIVQTWLAVKTNRKPKETDEQRKQREIAESLGRYWTHRLEKRRKAKPRIHYSGPIG